MGKYIVSKILPKTQQDYSSGETKQAQFSGDNGDVLFGWFVTLKGEDQKETVAQCWFKKGEEFKEGQEAEGELVPAQDKQGNSYYKFKKMGSGGGRGGKGGYAPRDYRKEALASAPTMTMSYAKDIVVALIASGVIKKVEDAQKQLVAISDAAFANAKTKIEENVAALPAQPAPTPEAKPTPPATENHQGSEDQSEDEGSEEAPAPTPPRRPINPEEDINIEDIPF